MAVADPAKAELAFMLPGFRFLLAATVLSTSMLVFGLGAAALLHAAHEQFASMPSWRAPAETVFAPQSEAAAPTLAVLRVDAPVEAETPEDVSAAAPPLEQAPTVAMPAEPEQVAAAKPEVLAAAEAAEPEILASDSQPPGEAPSAQTELPAAPDPTIIATTEIAPPPSTDAALPPPDEALPALSEPTSVAASVDADLASTKIATLGGPPVSIETQTPAKATDAKPDASAINKRQRARRAIERRRMAARAARPAQQQPVNPFAQPTITTRSH